MAIIDDLSQVGYSNEENYTEEEAVTIRRLIAENQALVDDLDAKMDSLLLKRDKHIDYILRGKAALSPLKELSQETIREVFLHASQGTIKVPFPYGPEDYDEDDPNCEELHIMVPTQVVLAQVCSAWRKMALSIPQLWNDILFIYNARDNTLVTASELLSRARGSGITLKALFFGYSKPVPKAFDLLIMPNSFKYLEIKLSSEELLQFYQQPLEACVNLESLVLEIIYDTTPHEISVTLDPDKYPRFKHLSIHLLGDRFINLQDSVIPWHQLTTLNLHIVRSSQLHVLHQCTSLTSLKIGIKWDGIHNTGEIYLPRLLNFTLPGASINNVPSLLRIFNFPNLEEFEAVKLTGHFPEDIQELMLQRFNFRQIRVLEISIWRDNIHQCDTLMCSMSGVTISPRTNYH